MICGLAPKKILNKTEAAMITNPQKEVGRRSSITFFHFWSVFLALVTFFVSIKTHKRKQMWVIAPGLGGLQNVVYVFWGSFLMGEKTHKHNREKSGTIPLKMLFMCYVLQWLFLVPKLLLSSRLLLLDSFVAGRRENVKLLKNNCSKKRTHRCKDRTRDQI